MKPEIVETTPLPEEYCQLRSDAGLSAKSMDAAIAGLPNSLYSVCIRDDQNLVGMGRVIGDGALFFQIVDIAVHPSYQKQGLGKIIIHKIEAYLASVAHRGAYVSLIADQPPFYRKLGYKETAPSSIGMYKVLS